MMEKPLELSRYCVPFTPFVKPLEESLVCLSPPAAVRGKADTPFNVEGDNTFRRIDSSLAGADLAYDDAHYDHACIDRDINCVFPSTGSRRWRAKDGSPGPPPNTSRWLLTGAARAARDHRSANRARRLGRAPDAVLLTAADGSATAPWSRCNGRSRCWGFPRS